MAVEFQGDMLGRSHPVFPRIAAWLKPYAEPIWRLCGEGTDQRIADDDPYMIVKYWVAYEGLGAVLGEDALIAFSNWCTAAPGPTVPENLRRTRQALTAREHHGKPVEPYMKESEHVHQARARKRQMITEQMGQWRERDESN